eukprot:symbB.v1.2.001169.t1/scaffold60.1/size581591/9
MDPTPSCNLICPKGQPPSSVLVPGRDRRDGSMEGRSASSKGSTERTGPFGSKGAATPGSNFEEALQKQLEVLKSELLQAHWACKVNQSSHSSVRPLPEHLEEPIPSEHDEEVMIALRSSETSDRTAVHHRWARLTRALLAPPPSEAGPGQIPCRDLGTLVFQSYLLRFHGLSGEALGEGQRKEMAKAFNFLALRVEGARTRKRNGLPMLLPKSEIPKLLRGCGRAPTNADLQELLESVGDEGIVLEDFYALYEKASEKALPTEHELLEAFRALDFTKTDTLDPKGLKSILCGMGDRLPMSNFDQILHSLPKDGLGRVSCRALARKLSKGPDGILHM